MSDGAMYEDAAGELRYIDTGALVLYAVDTVYGPEDVELCTRIADIPGAETLELEHWWLRTPNAEAGMGPEGAGVPGHGSSPDLPFSSTTINDHTGQGDLPDATCTPVTDLGWYYVDPFCVDEQLELGRATGRWAPPGNDCHTIVKDVLRDCSDNPNGDWPGATDPDPEYRYTGGDGSGGAGGY